MRSKSFLSKFFDSAKIISEDDSAYRLKIEPMNQNTSSHINVFDKNTIRHEGLAILMVEDNPFLRDSIRMFLEKLGMMVDCAENGLVGLEIFEGSPEKYDIVLMDIEMPVMGGIESAKRIRAINSASEKSLSIIAVTGSMFSDNPEMPIFQGILKKPFELEQLKSMVTKTWLRMLNSQGK